MNFFKRLAQPILHLAFLITRPLTVGVRGLCIDLKNNRLMLVRHTYSNGWSLPGGGVILGETTDEALKRELEEEAGIIIKSFNILEIFYNKSVSRRDHVIIYLIDSWHKKKFHDLPKIEIAEARWFSLNNLPESITPCTSYAIKKYLEI